MLVDGVGSRGVVNDVWLGVVIALRLFFAGALLDLAVTVQSCLFLDGELGISRRLIIFIIFESVTVYREAVQILEIRKKAHDMIDLVFCFQVDVQRAQDWKRADCFDASLEVFKFDVLEVEIGDGLELGEVFG